MSTRQLQCIRKLPFEPHILKAIINKGLQRLTKKGHKYDVKLYFKSSDLSSADYLYTALLDIQYTVQVIYCQKQLAEEKTQSYIKIITYI